MTGQSWRIDHMSGGTLAWAYVRPHAVSWSVPAAALAKLGYTVTEERQNLVDDKLGAVYGEPQPHSPERKERRSPTTPMRRGRALSLGRGA